MSILTYNCVTLPYPFHTDFKQEAVYDDLSKTDRILTKFDIKLQAVLNFNYLSLLASDLSGQTTNPAEIMQVVRERLLKPRQQLSIKMNGKELIPPIQSGNQGTVDAMNGPIPQTCGITTLTNTSFLITYHIIAHYWNSLTAGSLVPTVNQPASDVLYNRWTETVNIDERNMSQRIRDGKFVIRSDNVDGLIADQLRNQMAVVGVPPGFLRQSSQYIQDPSGLGIRYRVVDQEVYRKPPKPAFKATGRYTESSQFPYIIHTGEAVVKLEGDKDTTQRDLMDAAVRIIAQRLGLATREGGAGTTGFMGSNAVSVDMYDNVVEVRARTWLRPPGSGRARRYTFWTPDFINLVAPPFDNGGGPDFQPPYTTRGSTTAGILLQAAAYFDPNLRNTLFNTSTGNLNQGLQVGVAGQLNEGKSDCPNSPQASNSTTSPTSVGDNSLVPAQQFALVATAPVTGGDIGGQDERALYTTGSLPNTVWTDYHIKSRYESDKHLYMMPISSPNGFQPQSVSTLTTQPGQSNQSQTSSAPAGPTVAFVQLASPTTLLVCDFMGSRMNAKPTLPDPKKMVDQNWVLLDEHYTTLPIMLCADGTTPIYGIAGTYVYGHSNPDPNAFKNVQFSKAPWLGDNDVLERTLTTTDFQGGIIEGGTSTLTTNPSSIPPGLSPQ